MRGLTSALRKARERESDVERTMTFAALAQAPDRRRTEAWLLALVVLIAVFGYAYTGLSMTAQLPAASRQTPQRTITTRPAAAWVTRQ